MNSLLAPFLKDTYLFKNFSDDEISHVLKLSQHERLAGGDFLFTRGLQVDSFFILQSGSVRLYSMNPKEEMEYSIHIPAGGIIGESVVVTQEVKVMAAEVLETSNIIRIPCEPLKAYLSNLPEVGGKFYKALGEHLGRLTHNLILELLRIREAHHIERHSLSII